MADRLRQRRTNQAAREGRPLVPSLQGALLEITRMRTDVADLRRDLSEADAERLQSRVEAVERKALQLIAEIGLPPDARAH